MQLNFIGSGAKGKLSDIREGLTGMGCNSSEQASRGCQEGSMSRYGKLARGKQHEESQGAQILLGPIAMESVGHRIMQLQNGNGPSLQLLSIQHNQLCKTLCSIEAHRQQPAIVLSAHRCTSRAFCCPPWGWPAAALRQLAAGPQCSFIMACQTGGTLCCAAVGGSATRQLIAGNSTWCLSLNSPPAMLMGVGALRGLAARGWCEASHTWHELWLAHIVLRPTGPHLALLGVHVQLGQRLVGHLADQPQRMVGRDEVVQAFHREQALGVAVCAAHRMVRSLSPDLTAQRS